MTEQQPPTPVTPRVLAARAAAAALARTDGVTPVSGSRFATRDGGDRLDGVLAVAAAGGAVDVQLHVDVRWPVPPLEELAGALREATRREASAVQVTVGDVDVSVHDVAVDGAA